MATLPTRCKKTTICLLTICETSGTASVLITRGRYSPNMAAGAGIATRRGASQTTDTASWPRLTTLVTLASWGSVVVLAHVLLERVQATGANIRIQAAPLVGTFELRVSVRLLAALAVGTLLVFAAPRLVQRVGWGMLLVASAAAAALWAVSLALVDGGQGLTRSLEARTEYLIDVVNVGSPGEFLSTFVDRIRDYSVHVQGHPPGMLLVLSALDRVGLGGSGWAAALCIGGGAAAVPAVLVAVREVVGEEVARRAAPFVVVTPAAIWIATSADALFMGVSAWAVALLVLATGRQGRRSDAYALAGGLLFGASAFLSYGLVLLAVVPVLFACQRRRLRPLALAAAGAAPVFLAFAAAGFSWVGGLLATRDRYFAGVGSRRPYLDFLVANAACLAIALGPAVAVALTRLRIRALWLLVGGALVVVGAAMISGMSKGEVERIWLPFTVWLLPAGAALAAGRERVTTGWLGLQATAAIAVTTVVKTSW
jgi:methylthioxylose transferase